MRKILFLMLFSMCTFTAKPQSGLVHIDSNYVWSIMTTGWAMSFTTTYYFIQGDTVMNGHPWKKIYSSYLDSTLSNPTFTCGICEENGRVFISGGMFTTDSVVYDNNLGVGDTVPFCQGYKKVDSVNYVVLDGQSRKRIVFEPIFGFQETWIEGIGSNSGLPFALTYGCVFDIGFDLLCVHKDGNLIYDNPMFDGCFMSSIGIEEIKSSVIFYPNPLTDVSELIVKGNAEDYRNLIIYDLSGRMVREVPFNNNRIRICKGDFTRGIYFYLLIGKSKNYRGKFIVQ